MLYEVITEAGLGNIFVSNGYLSQQSSEKISPYLSAANIDLKSFSDTFYRDVCGARLQPVLDTIRLLHAAGVVITSYSIHYTKLYDDRPSLVVMAGAGVVVSMSETKGAHMYFDSGEMLADFDPHFKRNNFV